jgi:iron(III) transport system permease protein
MRARLHSWHYLAIAALLIAGVLPSLLPFAGWLGEPGEAWAALVDPILWTRLLRTLGILAATLLVALPVGLCQGWLLARSDLPGRDWFLILTPLPLFLPPLVHVLSWFGLLGLKGFPAIVLVYIIAFTPFVALMSVKALSQVSQAQAETLLLEGGPWAVLRDDLRQALPAAGVGAVLASVLVLSDFAVADFLTAVGPKVTVYADSLYAHHLALRNGGIAGAAIPGVILSGLALVWALRYRRRLGTAIGPDFVQAAPLPLGRARMPLGFLLALLIAMGTLLPLLALVIQAQSVEVFWQQAMLARGRIGFTALLGLAVSLGMVLLSLPLVSLAKRMQRPWALDLMIFLPFAVPALFFGVGLIRMWNHPGTGWIYDGPLVLWLALVGRYLSFAYLPMAGVLERVDPLLTEAARLDGAGPGACLWRIVWPLVRGPLLLVWCWSFCFTLRELDSLILLHAGHQSLLHHLYANVIFSRPDEVASIALLLILVAAGPLLVYLASARHLLARSGRT